MREDELMARAMNAAQTAKDDDFTETAKAFSALARYLGDRELQPAGKYLWERTIPPILDKTIPPEWLL